MRPLETVPCLADVQMACTVLLCAIVRSMQLRKQSDSLRGAER